MWIGDLAIRAGVTVRTIRYYEELGILEPAERTDGRFCLYSEDQPRRLLIVQNQKGLGVGLERMRGLFLLKTRSATGGELAASRIEHFECQQHYINARIEQYRDVKERNDKAIEIFNGCLCCNKNHLSGTVTTAAFNASNMKCPTL